MINKLLIALEQNDKDGHCVNILDAIRWVRSSCDVVTEGTISNCSTKAGFMKAKIVNTPDATIELLDECRDMFEQLKVHDYSKDILTVEDFVDVDKDLATNAIYMDTEIIKEVTATQEVLRR